MLDCQEIEKYFFLKLAIKKNLINNNMKINVVGQLCIARKNRFSM